MSVTIQLPEEHQLFCGAMIHCTALSTNTLTTTRVPQHCSKHHHNTSQGRTPSARRALVHSVCS